MKHLIGVDLATDPDQYAACIFAGNKLVLRTGPSPAICPVWINSLRSNCDEERETLAAAFTLIASNHGAEVEPTALNMMLVIRLKGVAVRVFLYGHRDLIISWCNDYGAPGHVVRPFRRGFLQAIGSTWGPGNGRATSCSDEWYDLAKWLDAGLLLAARGEAFAD